MVLVMAAVVMAEVMAAEKAKAMAVAMAEVAAMAGEQDFVITAVSTTINHSLQQI